MQGWSQSHPGVKSSKDLQQIWEHVCTLGWIWLGTGVTVYQYIEPRTGYDIVSAKLISAEVSGVRLVK